MDLGIRKEDAGWFGLAGLGLAFCLIMNGVFDSIVGTFANGATFAVRISDDPLSGGVSIILVCLIVVAVLARTGREPRLGVSGAVGIAAVQAASLVALLLYNNGTAPEAVGDMGGLALSGASVLLLALWAQSLSHAGRANTLLALAISLVLNTLFDLASVALVDEAIFVLCIVAGVASPFLLRATERMGAPGSASGNAAAAAAAARTEGDGAGFDAPKASGTVAKGDRALTFALACIAIYGFAMGRVQSVGSSSGSTTGLASFVSTYAVNIGAFAGAVLCVVCARLREPHGVTRIATLIVVAAALYFSGVFGTESISAGMLMMSLARLFIFVYIWLVACDAAPERGQTMLAFAAGWGTFTLANTVSTKLGLGVFADGAGYVAYNVLMMVCLAALVLLEFLPRRAGATDADGRPVGVGGVGEAGAEGATGASSVAGDATAAPAPTVQSAEEIIAAACQTLAERYALTEREREVLVPLVRGRSAPNIASALGMSTETARTHIQHIYQKLDVHSRSELMDIVDDL